MDKFPLPRLIDILIQVSQTIAYAHEMGVIHRDLKPANIIIGQFGEVYVLDWGLAKIIGSESIVEPEDLESQKADTTLTPVGKHYGTPMYMPPEVAKGEADIDGRTDVFSLGILLHEMMTLQFLFEGRIPMKSKRKFWMNHSPYHAKLHPKENSRKTFKQSA